jgi:hypothetical protein
MFGSWRDSEASECAPHFQSFRYTRPVRHACGASKLTEANFAGRSHLDFAGQSICRLGVPSRPAIRFGGGRGKNSPSHRAAETRVSDGQTSQAMRSHRRDCGGTSSTLGMVVSCALPCTWRPRFDRPDTELEEFSWERPPDDCPPDQFERVSHRCKHCPIREDTPSWIEIYDRDSLVTGRRACGLT